MSLRERTRPGLGIIEPCLPSTAKVPPSGPGWLHEIKHDGFRILARRDPPGVRLITRAGNDFSRFPFIAMAVSRLPVRSCLIDGEAIVCDEKGLAVFDLIRRHGALASAVLCAFDLLELDGKDLRREPIEKRKALLAKLLRGSHSSIVLNEYYEEDGEIVFREACRLGCEGIVSKRARLNLSPGAVAALGEGQKSECACCEARSGRGLGAMTVGRSLLLFGFVCLSVMVFTHVAEGLHLFSGMGWGLPDSPGHYLDFVSAVLGCALLIAGMIWISFNVRRSR